MWSPRAQNDRAMFAQIWREMLESTPNLDFYQDMVIILKQAHRSIFCRLKIFLCYYDLEN